MAYSIPVVASNVGGVPNIIEGGKNGILVEPGNSEAIRAAIWELYQDRDVRAKIGREAQATIRGEYSMQTWIHKVEAEYTKALEG
jgi:glycosyltransferase involved in cell wall biosynthesis